jgi:hypothetical protein
MTRESLVDEREVGRRQLSGGTAFSPNGLEQEFGLLRDGATQRFVERPPARGIRRRFRETAEFEPLDGEVGRKGRRARVECHATHDTEKSLRGRECSFARGREQRFVGRRAPQEVREAGGEFPSVEVAKRAGGSVGGVLLDPVEETRRQDRGRDRLAQSPFESRTACDRAFDETRPRRRSTLRSEGDATHARDANAARVARASERRRLRRPREAARESRPASADPPGRRLRTSRRRDYGRADLRARPCRRSRERIRHRGGGAPSEGSSSSRRCRGSTSSRAPSLRIRAHGRFQNP